MATVRGVMSKKHISASQACGDQPHPAMPSASNIWRVRQHGFSEFTEFHFHYIHKISSTTS